MASGGTRSRSIPVACHSSECERKTAGIAYCGETQIINFFMRGPIQSKTPMRLHPKSGSWRPQFQNNLLIRQ